MSENIEFVNRTDEIEALRARIPPIASGPTVTFLRSPSGFGKTRLTERLVQGAKAEGPSFLVVDPFIRSRGRSDRIYPWFFVQRACEQESLHSVKGQRGFRSFAEFLLHSPFAGINWGHVYENLKEAASLSKLIKFVIDLGENLAKKGRYEPNVVLQDASAFATQLALDYFSALVRYRPTVCIVRECQSIDQESLRFLLRLGQEVDTLAVICEYTSPESRFSPEHEKIVLDAVVDGSSVVILDLLRLNLKDFRFLLQKYTPISKKLEGAVELAWDGNLRIIKELKYRFMIGRSVETECGLRLHQTIGDTLDVLPRLHQLILALLVAHIEAIRPDTLQGVLKLIGKSIDQAEFDAALKSLAEKEEYISLQGNHIALIDEDIAEAAVISLRMTPVLRLAEAILRDFYLGVVRGHIFANVSFNLALRQAIALCGKTGDIVALRSLIVTLDAEARRASDQTIYVSIVADAALRLRDLSTIERRELVGWASGAAYEVGDYPTALALLESLDTHTLQDKAMLACCYGEVNRHHDALQIGQELATKTQHVDVSLAGKLIQCASSFALGRKGEAATLHASMRNGETFSQSPLFGFVLRFTEIISDFPTCTPDLLESAKVLRSKGLARAAAYSQIAAAMNVAAEGKVQTAKRLLSQAETDLSSHVRDRQLILNNRVVLDLLSKRPRFRSDADTLQVALFSARDAFSRLVLQSNLLICYWQLHDHQRAGHCADVIRRLLTVPGFGNRDVFWPACYNAWRFYKTVRDHEKAETFKTLAFARDLDDRSYRQYWMVRFGLEQHHPKQFKFLMRFEYHPEYLSHWVIDWDGFVGLTAESEGLLLQT